MQHFRKSSKTFFRDASLNDERTSSRHLKENVTTRGVATRDRPNTLRTTTSREPISHGRRPNAKRRLASLESPGPRSSTGELRNPEYHDVNMSETKRPSDLALSSSSHPRTPQRQPSASRTRSEVAKPIALDRGILPSHTTNGKDATSPVSMSDDIPRDIYKELVYLGPSTEHPIAHLDLPLASLCLQRSAFDVVHTPESGYGLVATEAFDIGSSILVEHPAVILPPDLETLVLESESSSSSMSRLPSDIRQEIMELSNCAPFDCSGIGGIVKTNAIPIELHFEDNLATSVIFSCGIFIAASRCNHSCVPNAIRRWDPRKLTLRLEAVRPIQPGEQITVSYVPLSQPRSERRAQLQDVYNFICQCPGCDLSEKRLAASDDVRRQLYNFHEHFPSFERWCFDLAFPDDILIRAHCRTLDLIAREQLEAHGREKHADIIAMCYGALGDEEQFTSWITQVGDIRAKRRPELGPVFTKWIADPRTFPVWNWRSLIRLGQPPKYDEEVLGRFFSPPLVPRSPPAIESEWLKGGASGQTDGL